MLRVAVFSFALALTVGLGGPVLRVASADDAAAAAASAEATVKAALVEARTRLVTGLVGLAEWSATAKLLGQRDRLALEILRIDPEHPKARAWLKYTKDRSGAWVQAKSYKPPMDVSNSAQLPELLRRRVAIGTEAVESVVSIVQRLGSALPLRRRELALHELVALAPDDERVRATLGHVRDGAGFVLAETKASRERRPVLAAQAEAALAAVVDPLPVTPTSMERLFSKEPWARSYATTDLRILGPSVHASALLLRAIRCGQAARQAFTQLLGTEVPEIAGLTFFLYALPADAYEFLEKTPLLQDPQREIARRLSCYWMPDGPYVLVYPVDDDTRIEWVPRVVVSGMLSGGFDVTPDHGVLFEGIGLWMTTRLCGTHGTVTVRRADYADDRQRDDGLVGRMQANDADWLAEARGILARKLAPDLRLAFGKDVNNLTAEDLIFAYALATFLFEAHPQKVAPLLEAFPNLPLDAAVERSLGLSVEGLEGRLVRWLEETAPPPAPPPPPRPPKPVGPRPPK